MEVTILVPEEGAEPIIEGTQEENRQTLDIIQKHIDRIAEKAAEFGIKKMIFHPTYYGAEEGEKISVRLDDGTGKSATSYKFKEWLSINLRIRLECCYPFDSEIEYRVHIAHLSLLVAYQKIYA